MTEAFTDRPARAAVPSGRVWRAGLLGSLAATLANVLVWLVLQQVLDLDLQIPVQPGGTELQQLPLATVAVATLVPALLGTLLLWLLTRRNGPGGIRLWTILAAAFALLSLFAPFGLDVSTGRRLGLLVFHVLTPIVYLAVTRQQLASG
jgi:hypothetical protein